MFSTLKLSIQGRFSLLQKEATLFKTDVDTDTLFSTYLACFPEETRQEYNCNCCKSFLRNYGNIVSIAADGTLRSLWQFELTGEYEGIPAALHALVVSAPILSPFFSKEKALGTDFNYQFKDGIAIKWEHFYLTLPSSKMVSSSTSIEALVRDKAKLKGIAKKALDTISIAAVDKVLAYIANGESYRSAEFLKLVEEFSTILRDYLALPEEKRDNFIWLVYPKVNMLAHHFY